MIVNIRCGVLMLLGIVLVLQLPIAACVGRDRALMESSAQLHVPEVDPMLSGENVNHSIDNIPNFRKKKTDLIRCTFNVFNVSKVNVY